jgi:hypothetical protein
VPRHFPALVRLEGLSVDEIWPGDIDAFRRDFLASGRTSPGEYHR